MKTSRRLRSLFALFALVGVLFSQLAMSAYACQGAAAMSAAVVEAMPDMPGCDEAAPEAELSALCQAHCLKGDQSLDKSGVALPPMAAALAYPVAARVQVAEPDPGRPFTLDPLLERPTGPPLAVRHCRFRI